MNNFNQNNIKSKKFYKHKAKDSLILVYHNKTIFIRLDIELSYHPIEIF